MQPILSKKIRFITLLISLQVVALRNYDFYYLYYFSLLSPFFFYKNLPFKLFLHTPKPYQPYQSFFISSKRANNLLFIAFYKAKKENKTKIRVFLEKSLEI